MSGSRRLERTERAGALEVRVDGRRRFLVDTEAALRGLFFVMVDSSEDAVYLYTSCKCFSSDNILSIGKITKLRVSVRSVM